MSFFRGGDFFWWGKWTDEEKKFSVNIKMKSLLEKVLKNFFFIFLRKFCEGMEFVDLTN